MKYIPLCKCKNCGYSDIKESFKKPSFKWQFRKERCPKCKSTNVVSSEKPVVKEGWKKVEDKTDGSVSWTEYTDFNNEVFTIYDMKAYPSTPNAYLK